MLVLEFKSLTLAALSWVSAVIDEHILGVYASMWTQDEQVLSFLFQLWDFYILALSWLF